MQVHDLDPKALRYFMAQKWGLDLIDPTNPDLPLINQDDSAISRQGRGIQYEIVHQIR